MKLNISTFIHILLVNYLFILFYFYFHSYLAFSSKNLLSMVDIGFSSKKILEFLYLLKQEFFLGAFWHLNAQRNNPDGQH
jgi:hypothetical protein